MAYLNQGSKQFLFLVILPNYRLFLSVSELRHLSILRQFIGVLLFVLMGILMYLKTLINYRQWDMHLKAKRAVNLNNGCYADLHITKYPKVRIQDYTYLK